MWIYRILSGYGLASPGSASGPKIHHRLCTWIEVQAAMDLIAHNLHILQYCSLYRLTSFGTNCLYFINEIYKNIWFFYQTVCCLNLWSFCATLWEHFLIKIDSTIRVLVYTLYVKELTFLTLISLKLMIEVHLKACKYKNKWSK